MSSPSEPLAVALDVAAAEAELDADRLFSLGASAVSEERLGDGRVRLVADLDHEALAELIASGQPARVLEPQAAWDRGWRAHARVWRCGEHLVVRPAWVDPEPLADGDVEVLVEPGGAFGSGSHPTTRLCLAAIERLVAGGETVLDVGCGSGVLAVAAALLGAARVDAIDVDPEAVKATTEVAGLNGTAGIVHASTTPLAGVPGRFDLVLANLLVPIIEELGPQLVERCAPGGTLVLSGLLPEHRDRAVAAVAPFRQVAVRELEGWIALELSDG